MSSRCCISRGSRRISGHRCTSTGCGRGVLRVGGGVLCPPGTFVYVPGNTSHTFKVVSAVPGKKLNLFSPAAMLGS
jgi:hypothetical protein